MKRTSLSLPDDLSQALSREARRRSASVVALAERLQAPIVITLDHRHFQAARHRHRDAFELLP
jgi:hypothetical protein